MHTLSLSYKEIAAATDIPAADLKRSLQSLACAKGKNVLTKVGAAVCFVCEIVCVKGGTTIARVHQWQAHVEMCCSTKRGRWAAEVPCTLGLG